MSSATRILVVEDEGLVAQDLKCTLEDLGYVVPAIASTGEAAISKAAEANPDLILMDIVLQGGMDGVTATEQISAAFDIPVVYFTQLMGVAYGIDAKSLGLHKHIADPISLLKEKGLLTA